MYTRRGSTKLTVGALWLSPWGEDNGSHTTYLVSEAMYSASFLEPTEQ
jgi:hypothetical protein